MKTYKIEDLEMFFERSNMSCGKLASLLGIGEWLVEKYLLAGREIAAEEMTKIDTAIEVIDEFDLRRPEWDIRAWREHPEYNAIDTYEKEVMDLLTDKDKREIRFAINNIMAIIGNAVDDKIYQCIDNKFGNELSPDELMELANGGIGRCHI